MSSSTLTPRCSASTKEFGDCARSRGVKGRGYRRGKFAAAHSEICQAQGTGALNQPYKFRWDAVSGASHYNLKEQDSTCPQNPDIVTIVPANEAQPYEVIGRLTMCGGQERDPTKFIYSLQACSGSTCSGWSPTVTVTVRASPPRPGGVTATYIHTDGLRSPVAETNEAGTVTSRMRYEPYGAPTTGSQAPGPGYTGHVRDDATGLSYMQQRYYDPIGGRFLSTDPVAADAANFNRYWYAGNNPYKNIDPDGRDPEMAYGAAVGLMFRNDSEKMRVWSGGEAAATTMGSRAEAGAALSEAIGNFVETGDYSTEAVSRFAVMASVSAITGKRVSYPTLAKLGGMLRDAARGKGNFGIGSATSKRAEAMGKAWVGRDHTLASDGKTMISKDGLRQYRPPSEKSSPHASTGVQANFERREKPEGPWINNAHLDIKDKK